MKLFLNFGFALLFLFITFLISGKAYLTREKHTWG